MKRKDIMDGKAYLLIECRDCHVKQEHRKGSHQINKCPFCNSTNMDIELFGGLRGK